MLGSAPAAGVLRSPEQGAHAQHALRDARQRARGAVDARDPPHQGDDGRPCQPQRRLRAPRRLSGYHMCGCRVLTARRRRATSGEA